ncbi:hypothetical protein DA482_00150 [Pseudomonas fluorescens]|nr:hypothetical protein FIP59_27700 [Pseudomonas fluorescens]
MSRGIANSVERVGSEYQSTPTPVGAGVCGSWLACDPGTSVIPIHRGDAIAGKPAPTGISVWH